MVLLLAALSLLAAEPRGVAVKDDADLVKTSAKLAPTLTKSGPKLERLLANDAELNAFIAPTAAIMNAEDRKAMREAIVVEQSPIQPCKKFAATAALHKRTDTGAVVHLFDRKDRHCAMMWTGSVEQKRLVLVGAPMMDDRGIAKELESAREASEGWSYFEHKKGKWVSAPLPPPPPPSCEERLRAASKAVYMAEQMHRAEFEAYTNDEKKISAEAGPALEGVKLRITKADAAAFEAEVSLEGGVMRTTDAKDFDVVKACKPAGRAKKGKAR